MKFFKPEDFYEDDELDTMKSPRQASDLANAKLEREGTVVYGYGSDNFQYVQTSECTHRALLICIEPLDRCSHPAEKVKFQKGYSGPAIPGQADDVWYNGFKCECGAKVTPNSFSEVKEVKG